ncbi:MAG: glycoside hydrolase family 1 protein [Candidatus Marinimicrobia bacterium]|nr:glycoside hydrolase family 1 protein [Candidatus Neomarinimicrobiota bacterium]
MKLEFPKNFLWGAATSSYQVEGGNKNDWTSFVDAGKACDHYNRFEEDFDIAKSLGHNVHRFSIEWSRVEPREGEFDEVEIEHYKKVVNALRERGVEPFVTLYHWTLPTWLSKKGGWLHKDTPKYFERYVRKIITSCGDVKFWVTINEPNIYTSNSFLKGVWPPQKKSIFKYFKVLKQLTKAHKNSYKAIKKTNPEAWVGISKNNIYFEKILFANYFWNKRFLNKIKKQQDFIGLNYYFHYKLSGNDNKQVSDMGWEIYPEGIYHVLKGLKKYNKPIYITENGLADSKDEKREKFIKSHLRYVHKAISDGVDVRGYMHWSLLDNFEWDKGFWPRFGLVEIDYKTMERKIRKSALEYAKICKSNFLES